MIWNDFGEGAQSLPARRPRLLYYDREPPLFEASPRHWWLRGRSHGRAHGRRRLRARRAPPRLVQPLLSSASSRFSPHLHRRRVGLQVPKVRSSPTASGAGVRRGPGIVGKAIHVDGRCQPRGVLRLTSLFLPPSCTPSAKRSHTPLQRPRQPRAELTRSRSSSDQAWRDPAMRRRDEPVSARSRTYPEHNMSQVRSVGAAHHDVVNVSSPHW